MKKTIIIDYGMGNLDSVKRAVEECGSTAIVTDNPIDLKKASNIILPGVGAFPVGMKHVVENNFVDEIYEQVIVHKIPFLGICLGMQLLADWGNEVSRCNGLGLIKGEVKKFIPSNGERIPHIGWNEINIINRHKITENVNSGSDFYFVHSYSFDCNNPNNIVATTNYCMPFPSIIASENVLGTQFHPEKSQKMGFMLLRNFLDM